MLTLPSLTALATLGSQQHLLAFSSLGATCCHFCLYYLMDLNAIHVQFNYEPEVKCHTVPTVPVSQTGVKFCLFLSWHLFHRLPISVSRNHILGPTTPPQSLLSILSCPPCFLILQSSLAVGRQGVFREGIRTRCSLETLQDFTIAGLRESCGPSLMTLQSFSEPSPCHGVLCRYGCAQSCVLP